MKELISKLFGVRGENSEAFEMSRKKFITYLIFILPALTFLVAACGGGGGGGERTDH